MVKRDPEGARAGRGGILRCVAEHKLYGRLLPPSSKEKPRDRLHSFRSTHTFSAGHCRAHSRGT